ncbi:MAG: restriction endonuclease [Bacteroidota bacterium]
MIIDFKEIPRANGNDGDQDRFEQFACDFFETCGYSIECRPSRGADGGKDLIIKEPSMHSKAELKWIVSCKHYGHSRNSIGVEVEVNILERVEAHNCHGFMGFYSSSISSSLASRLNELKAKIHTNFFDNARIEQEILLLNPSDRDRILHSYFPKSFSNFHQEQRKNGVGNQKKKLPSKAGNSYNDWLRASLDAAILLDIEKIKEEFIYDEWQEKTSPLFKLYRYIDYNNFLIANAIFSLSEYIVETSRSLKQRENIADEIFSLVLAYFPPKHMITEKQSHVLGKTCLGIGFNTTYDALLYRSDYDVAKYGLLIIKFIYNEAKRNDIKPLLNNVLEIYKELENSLNRPDRKDLETAKEFVAIFKNDLATPSLSMPILTAHLSLLVK